MVVEAGRHPEGPSQSSGLAGPAAVKALALATALLAPNAWAQSVTNVRAGQLPDKTVEVLYDLAGADPVSGATVTVAFSGDGGATYSIAPASSTLSGHVGAGITSGASRRIIWTAAATLPAGTYGTAYWVEVTATTAGCMPGAQGNQITVCLPGGVPLVMIRVPSGTFQMGSPPTERGRTSDETLHSVTLTSDFYLGKYEVTRGQWKAIMGADPSDPVNYIPNCGDPCPVSYVSWNAITGVGGFLDRLHAYLQATQQDGVGKYRLPTEAEWEHGARAGTETRLSFGDVPECGDVCTPCPAAAQYAWYCASSGYDKHPVGLLRPNAFGLYDMHGNQSEWVQDWWADLPSSSQTNPQGPASGSWRVAKGGEESNELQHIRSARRYSTAPSNTVHGFRLARSL